MWRWNLGSGAIRSFIACFGNRWDTRPGSTVGVSHKIFQTVFLKDGLDGYRLLCLQAAFHRRHHRDRHDPFMNVGLWHFTFLDASREVFDVVLIFTRVVAAAAEAEVVGLLVRQV